MFDSSSDILLDSDLMRHLVETVTTASATPEISDEFNKKMALLLHYHSFCTIFRRLSCELKIKLISDMAPYLRSIASLSLIINILYACLTKVNAYVKTEVDCDYVYDKILLDHNRMLDDKELGSVLDEEMEWFQTIADHEQEGIVISLLRISGGGVIRSIYWAFQHEYNKRRRQQAKLDEKSRFQSTSSIKSTTPTLKSGSETPLTLECNEKLNEWNKLIGDYKIKIYGKPKKVTLKRRKSSSARSLKKSKKSSKKKSKKQSKHKKKSKKKSKKSSKHEDVNLGLVELLPLQVVRRIFSYLDAKSLANCKKVDPFWKFSVEEYLKNVKTRKYLNSFTAKLKEDLNVEYEAYNASECEKQLRLIPTKLSFHERKMNGLWKRGAILKKLRKSDIDPTSKHSIVKDLFANNECLISRVIDTFTRVPKEKMPLIKYPNQLIRDVGLWWQLSDVDERQRSTQGMARNLSLITHLTTLATTTDTVPSSMSSSNISISNEFQSVSTTVTD